MKKLILSENKTKQCKSGSILWMICLNGKKSKIKEALKESGKFAVKFDKYGIIPASYPFLDNVVGDFKRKSGYQA